MFTDARPRVFALVTSFCGTKAGILSRRPDLAALSSLRPMGASNSYGKGARVRTYAVYSDSVDVIDRAESSFAENYKISEGLILVRSDLLTGTLARKLGLLDEESPTRGGGSQAQRLQRRILQLQPVGLD